MVLYVPNVDGHRLLQQASLLEFVRIDQGANEASVADIVLVWAVLIFPGQRRVWWLCWGE